MSKVEAENDRDRVVEVLGDFVNFNVFVRIANRTSDRTIGQICLTSAETTELISNLIEMRGKIDGAEGRAKQPL